MARTAAPARRAPARRLPAAPAVSQQLPPRVSSWGREATSCVAAGLACFGAAPLLEHPGLGVPGLALGVLGGAARVLHGRREQTRGALADRVAEALAPLLGLRVPDRRTVTLRWRRGRSGVPRRIDLRYAPGVDDSDPAWLPEVLQAVERRLQAVYEVRSHDRRRCRLQLAPAAPTVAGEPARALQVRAERTVLELLGPTAVVTGVQWDGEDLVGLDVRHEAGAKLSASGYRHRVERVVSTLLPGRWRAQWDLEADTVRFEVRPAFPSSVWLPVDQVDPRTDLLAAYDDLEVDYGVDEDGAVLRWRLTQDPHVMLVGATGSGKTVTAHTLLVQLTRRNVPVWIVDGKGVEFLGFQDWPNVQVVATTIEEQVAVIHRAWELMEYRYELVTSGRARESDFEPLVLFLDEFADFRGNLLDWYGAVKVKGDPTKPAALSKNASLARKARTARIHLVFGTQRPDAEFFGSGEMRDNFRLRISMGRLSPQGAQMMWESPAIGTSIPKGCRGRATTINDANRAVEIQTYRTPDPRKVADDSEEAQLLARLRPPAVVHERLLIVPPQGEADLDTGEVKDPTYTEYAGASWVRASQRPDLDPVHKRREEAVDGRALSSTMAVFGLLETDEDEKPAVTEQPAILRKAAAAGTPAAAPAQAATPARLRVVPDPDRFGADDDGAAARDLGVVEDYGPAMQRAVSELVIGDLVLVDEDLGLWGVVDQDVEPDLADPGCLAVSWRSDDDDCGLLSVPDDQVLLARGPIELDDPA